MYGVPSSEMPKSTAAATFSFSSAPAASASRWNRVRISRRSGEIAAQELDREAPPDHRVVRLVDDAHPPVREQTNDAVLAADQRADGDSAGSDRHCCAPGTAKRMATTAEITTDRLGDKRDAGRRVI